MVINNVVGIAERRVFKSVSKSVKTNQKMMGLRILNSFVSWFLGAAFGLLFSQYEYTAKMLGIVSIVISCLLGPVFIETIAIRSGDK